MPTEFISQRAGANDEEENATGSLLYSAIRVHVFAFSWHGLIW